MKKKPLPVIAVLCGGISSEHEVSLGSGHAAALALARHFPTRIFEVKSKALPAGLDPAIHVVFSTLHGTFGEDGGMQALLDKAGIHYAGCDAASSSVCFNKGLTKAMVSASGVRVCDGFSFHASRPPTLEKILARCGDQVVIKPNSDGSSVGLQVLGSEREIAEALTVLPKGDWLLERRIIGRELTVGVLDGKAMGVVEIVPQSGLFDYKSKYTKGLTEYRAPAPLPKSVTLEARRVAERAFLACGCRDYARMDFMLSEKNELFFLEINTLPGMKDTSLLPMSASCVGLDYTALVRELVKPALARRKKAAAKRKKA